MSNHKQEAIKTMRTMTTTYRTKTEAKAAIKAGERIEVTDFDGNALPKANGGPFTVQVALDHYKPWKGEAYCEDGRVYRLV